MKEKQIKINDEYLEKYYDNVQFNNMPFQTDKEIEVRIPFTGYYSLKFKCKNPQVAMACALEANRDIGINSLVGTETIIEDIIDEDTYTVVKG